MNIKLLSAMISTGLHLKNESEGALDYEVIAAYAAKLRKCLKALYPVSDRGWQEVLKSIEKYASCLV